MKRFLFALFLAAASTAGTASACDCQKKQAACDCGGEQSCSCPGMAQATPPAQKHKGEKPKPDSKRRDAAR